MVRGRVCAALHGATCSPRLCRELAGYLYFSAHSDSFRASLMYLSGISSGSLLLATRKPTGADVEKARLVFPKRFQKVLFEGSLPSQSRVPNFTLDVTDMRFDAVRNASLIVTFSFAHCSIQGSPPKNTCAFHLPRQLAMHADTTQSELTSLRRTASSSATVVIVEREIVKSEYRHMPPMNTPADPRPYFHDACLISSARLRSLSRSSFCAFFSARAASSLFGFDALRRVALDAESRPVIAPARRRRPPLCPRPPLSESDFTDEQRGRARAPLSHTQTVASAPFMAAHCLQEVVVSGSAEDECMHLWDLGTATTLVSYRPAAPASAAAVASIGRDFLAIAQAAKASLHVFQWRKDQPHARMALPERLVAVAATADGAHIAGGAESGRLYLWEACSGAMLRTWEGHYRSLTHMAFTDDGSHLITCSEDSLVRTWACGQLLDYNALSSLPPTPASSWNYHTLPVTGLSVGAGGVAAYICTVSADRSLVVAQIPSGPGDRGHRGFGVAEGNDGAGGAGGQGRDGSLATVAFPTGLTAVVLHPADQSVYVGAGDGLIYCVDLCSPVASSSGGASFAVANRLRGHEGAVLCLAMSLEGCLLISGSRDCSAKVWDCVSGQCLKSFAAHTGPVTYVSTRFRPPQMLDGSHVKCTTPLAFLARRHEMSAPDVPGYAGPNRRFPVLTQAISVAAGVGGAGATRSDGSVAHGGKGCMDVDGTVADSGGAEAEAASARAEADRWRALAHAVHTFAVDVLVPQQS